MNALSRLAAVDLVERLRRREVSPAEAVGAALARIAETDGAINAVPILCAERAYEAARAFPPAGADREGPGWLAGLPVVVKDLSAVAGVRFTEGSPIFAERVAERSDIMVETLERRGAIVIGKSNTPEFGAGSNTFNEVFGKTRNPWNTALSAGGSSGGSAAALASGQVWLATGSDLGGSLRNPASFCSVVGLRPSPGRVARGPAALPFETLSVEGPMARTVADVALMLDAMAGAHVLDPLSLAAPPTPFVAAARAARPPMRVAFSRDLGFAPIEAEVAGLCERSARRFAELGAVVEEACPDFSRAVAIFHILRAIRFLGLVDHLRDSREELKPEVVWNIEKGLALGPEDVAWAEEARGRLYHDVARFFERYDLLLCPAAQVAPFDVDRRYVEEIAGQKFDNYIDWIAITYAITLTACPALSLPCAFTAGGLPVGLQMVGRPRGEAALLSAAAAAETLFGLRAAVPIDPRSPSHPQRERAIQKGSPA